MNDALQKLAEDLPDRTSALRFIEQFEVKNRSAFQRLDRNPALMSDVLTLASFSPLIASTMLQNPDYVSWLEKKRTETLVASKDDLLESLARFSLTHSTLDLHVMLARFRRRELMRIYLRDIRRLATIAEITEEISNLADAILEFALQHARRVLDNLYGIPLETDERGRSKPAEFCIVSLGKLGSKELNYASDIDLLFIYSADGVTAGQGEKGQTTNLEYFTRLSQRIVKTVGQQTGEGAAYRVDLRLRPHGTLGPLAQSLADTVRYYRSEARRWEMQVLIRSRSSAGEAPIYSSFFEQLSGRIFDADASPSETLANVKASKERIDRERTDRKGFNVKLGTGGIREIEFLAQGLQLAYGGRDRWLRAPHTLISLSRLADRHHISESEHTELSSAYDFLRRLEHILQMENGLQTHTIPNEPAARRLLSARMGCDSVEDFDRSFRRHTESVHRIFGYTFTAAAEPAGAAQRLADDDHVSLDETGIETEEDALSANIREASPRYGSAILSTIDPAGPLADPNEYGSELLAAADDRGGLKENLSVLRQTWSRFFYRIIAAEILGEIDMHESKRRQTLLAEASLDAAIALGRREAKGRYQAASAKFAFAVLAVGKLGGASVDYESDLDVIFVYDESDWNGPVAASEFYSKVAETVITALSAITKDGTLYRVDLRLRPYGSKGQVAMSDAAFIEYLREKADIWELLAFVKVRGVAGDIELAKATENTLRSIIHDRGATTDPTVLRDESVRVRLLLEKQRAGRRTEIDIKYGEGGMLDVYFAMRYLQLVHNIPDSGDDRSTTFMLGELHRRDALTGSQHGSLAGGYAFLSTLDHYLRLVVGRTTKLPSAESAGLHRVARLMNLEGTAELIEQLSLHRLNIRSTFLELLPSDPKGQTEYTHGE